jgi:hypothetical protein
MIHLQVTLTLSGAEAVTYGYALPSKHATYNHNCLKRRTIQREARKVTSVPTEELIFQVVFRTFFLHPFSGLTKPFFSC